MATDDKLVSKREWAKPSKKLTISIKGKLPDIEPKQAKPAGHYSGYSNKDVILGLTVSVALMLIVALVIIFKDQL